MQYFPCDGVVADVQDSYFTFWAKDFSGNPRKASFTYSNVAQTLKVSVYSIFNNVRLFEDDGWLYSEGRGERSVIHIDLATEAAVAHVTYDVNPDNLYTFVCVNEAGSNVDCEITWYDPFEYILFSGNISELSGPEILPTWMSGKIFIEDLQGGFGDAENSDLDLYSENFDVDTLNRVITFTLVELPQ